MAKPLIHGVRPLVTASRVRDAVASDLSLIRQQDGLTWADIGRVLGKSEDQAAKYADGSAEIGIVSHAFARQQWNGRFTGSLDRLIHEARGDTTSDREKGSAILKAALALSEALEDGEIDTREVRANRATLENARDAIDAVLGKLTPRAA